AVHIERRSVASPRGTLFQWTPRRLRVARRSAAPMGQGLTVLGRRDDSVRRSGRSTMDGTHGEVRVGRAGRRGGAILAALVASALGLGSLAACTSPPDTSKPVPLENSSPSPSADQAKIVAAYDTFMNAYVQAYATANPAGAEGALTPIGGISGGGVDVGLEAASSAHVTAAGKPSWTTPVVSLDMAHAQATATNCFDPATWHTVGAGSHQP